MADTPEHGDRSEVHPRSHRPPLYGARPRVGGSDKIDAEPAGIEDDISERVDLNLAAARRDGRDTGQQEKRAGDQQRDHGIPIVPGCWVPLERRHAGWALIVQPTRGSRGSFRANEPWMIHQDLCEAAMRLCI